MGMTMTQQADSALSAGTRNYHSFLACDEEATWLDAAQDQVATWLRSTKKWDLDLSINGAQVQPDTGRRLRVRNHQHSNERAFRVVLEESNYTGTWTTDFIAVENAREGGGWISLDVTSGRGAFVKTPRLARFLGETLHVSDGGEELAPTPRVVTVDRLDALVGLITNASRRGAVLVAGTDYNLDFGAFTHRVGDWTREVAGLAHVFVLDPAATTQMASRLGGEWSAPPWTVRTYMPGLDRSRPASLGVSRGSGDTGRQIGGSARLVRKTWAC